MKGRGTVGGAEVSTLAAVAICLVMLLATGIAHALDDRVLRGASVWAKPVKFALSFGLHLATLLLFARLLPDRARFGWPASLALLCASAAALVEVLYVALQSARGRSSHFNTETALEAFMYYQVMGGAALVITGATILLGALVLMRPGSHVGPGLRLGAGWGAIASSLATLAVAGTMATGAVSGSGPWVGEPASDAGGIPLLGWSRQTGDLRVSHFAATHLIQILAIAGWIADRLAPAAARAKVSRLVVPAAAMLGLLLTAALFVQALRGEPLLKAAALAEPSHSSSQDSSGPHSRAIERAAVATCAPEDAHT